MNSVIVGIIQHLQEKYGLSRTDFFRYLQIGHFVKTHFNDYASFYVLHKQYKEEKRTRSQKTNHKNKAEKLYYIIIIL